MSKVEQKYLENYSIDTLRDVDLSGLSNQDVLEYDGSNFINRPRNKFGEGFVYAERVGLEVFSGEQFQSYLQIQFSVDELGATYRTNCDFLWGHDSASSDIRVAISLDGGVNVKEFRVEPKDAGTDQRYQDNILKYFENLSVGTHTIDLLCRPALSTRQSRIYETIIEVWKCQ